VTTVNAMLTRRMRAIDPLLPAPTALPEGCGAELLAALPDGQPSAIATCVHWLGEPGSFDLTWGAERRFLLKALIAGPHVAGPLDQLLSRWRDHLADVPDTKDEDTAAILTWPSRDVDGIPLLLRHGFVPFGVVAARVTPASRRFGDEPDQEYDIAGDIPVPVRAGSGVRIRRASAEDTDACVCLGLETVRFDAHFGAIERPSTAEAVRREFSSMLSGPEPWVWLAERDGVAIGMLAAQRPELAGWIAPMVALTPAAYLMFAAVLPHERGSGVGAAMVARFHRDIARAAVPVTIVEFEQTNPLSAPFWALQGYRPLWTSWEARPACTVR
jgi:hypothetical protein